MANVNRVREIFDGAIERHGDARQAFLDGACAGDTSLRAKIEGLIAAAEKEDEFLSEPTADSSGFTSAATMGPTPRSMSAG